MNLWVVGIWLGVLRLNNFIFFKLCLVMFVSVLVGVSLSSLVILCWVMVFMYRFYCIGWVICWIRWLVNLWLFVMMVLLRLDSRVIVGIVVGMVVVILCRWLIVGFIWVVWKVFVIDNGKSWVWDGGLVVKVLSCLMVFVVMIWFLLLWLVGVSLVVLMVVSILLVLFLMIVVMEVVVCDVVLVMVWLCLCIRIMVVLVEKVLVVVLVVIFLIEWLVSRLVWEKILGLID